MHRTATLWLLAASVSLSAQTTPAPNAQAVSVTGCVAQVQRDGSMGPKGTGTTSTPETAPVDANSSDQTGRYQLLDATPIESKTQTQATGTSGTASSMKPEKTTYTLRGQENELSKHIGHRVQITATLMPPIERKLPAQSAKMAEGVRMLQVSGVKMMGRDCSPSPAPASK